MLLILLLAGCSAGLKNRWVDFNAYFNTYYNAQESYKRGYTLVQNQVVVFNPARPIQVHLTPARAGQAEFEKAIEKSANILREYPDSRWADDALELIGKSYFYLGQFYSAEQKFDEVLMASPSDDLRQHAILWKGRIFLETNRNAEGISYLDSRIVSEEFEWIPSILSEVDLVLAQMYVKEEDFASAEFLLKRGLPGIDDRNLRSRGYFLLGQLYLELDKPNEAFDAFNLVDRSYKDYNLIYLSEVQKGRILRGLGNYTQAMNHFRAMSRDDKHFDQLADLNYEMARTKHDQDRHEEALDEYLDVLYNSLMPPARVTVALTHYGLGELHRFEFGDYALAAAYYDSSARAVTDAELLPRDFDATALAKSFGDYTRLSKESARLDSLLHIARLPRVERDSVIQLLRTSRLAAYEIRQRELQRQGTTLVSTNPGAGQGQNPAQGNSGFLNHRNPQLVAQAAESFAAVWQGRPLVDNWRRLEVTRNARIEEEEVAGEVGTGTRTIQNRAELDAVLQINLNDLPLTADKQDDLEETIASLEYEIGNVFYLTLNMPDSALSHYQFVVNRFPEAKVSPQAMYSIADVALSASDSVEAFSMARLLRSSHMGSEYERRLSRRLGLFSDDRMDAPVQRDSLSVAYETLIMSLDSIDAITRANSLRQFSEAHPDFSKSGDLLFASAQAYAEAGRTSPDYARLTTERQRLQQEHALAQAQLDTLKRRAVEKLADEETPEEDRLLWESIQDSTLSAPDLRETYPFNGAEWDSTRSVLNELVSRYPQHPAIPKARILLTDLTPLPEVVEDIAMVPCADLDQPITVRGGMDAFVEESGVKALMERVGAVEADFEFEIIINEEGTILNVVPIGEEDEFGFIRLLNDRMKTGLTYFPPVSGGKPVRTSCDIVISVRP